MKIGVKANGLIETLLLIANQIPTPLVETFSAMMNAKAILAANEIGVFNALAERPLTSPVLAKHLGISARGMIELTDALCGNGYLARRGRCVALTTLSRKWLVRSSPHYIGNMLEHVNDLWAVWLNLEEALRTGVPPASQYQDWLKDAAYHRILRRHIVGLNDLVRINAPEVTRIIRIPTAKTAAKAGSTSRRLLDIGGGHGGYAMAFCRQHPDLTATVFELPATAEIGREIVAREAMSERVQFQVGDFLTDDLGADYTAALYFNILHNYSEADNRRVLEKVFAALRPGGVLAVWDMFQEPGGARDVQPALMALHMLVASGGTSYLMDEVKGWLAELGFRRLTHRKTRTLPGSTLIIVRKP
jgi:SAM-dependent methyltransferase